MKKVNNMLNTIMSVFIGAFIGNVIYKTIHYSNNPDFYIANSSPWYTSILVYGVVAVVVVGTCCLIKYAVKKKY